MNYYVPKCLYVRIRTYTYLSYRTKLLINTFRYHEYEYYKSHIYLSLPAIYLEELIYRKKNIRKKPVNVMQNLLNKVDI